MSDQPLATDKRPLGPPVGPGTGVELNVPGQTGATGFDLALEHNRAFAAAGSHEGAVVFPNCGCS